MLLDCDGVICDFLGGLLAAVNEDRNTDFLPCDCDRWDIGAAYGLDWKYLSSLAEESGFCADLQPLPGAIEAIAALDLRADVYCVTSPFSGPHWHFERTAWLKRNFSFDKSHVIHAYTKRLIRGDFLIDDKPETICEWAEAWPSSTALLWDAPYNRGGVLPSNARRVHGWPEVLQEVGK
jgi:5'(3')-deoxyribonucleotidase